MSAPLAGSSAWVPLSEAPERVNRSRSTIYKWIQDGEVRVFRPMRIKYVYMPDLLRMDGSTQTRERVKSST